MPPQSSDRLFALTIISEELDCKSLFDAKPAGIMSAHDPAAGKYFAKALPSWLSLLVKTIALGAVSVLSMLEDFARCGGGQYGSVGSDQALIS
jgi:hypothetical protein